MGLNFKMANGDHTVVTLSLPFFVAYADQLAHAAAQFSRDEYWRDVPK